MTARRLPAGGLIDRSTTLGFTFDGKRFEGHPGDTLASALLANGVRVVGRSFKYHRPRGVLTAGPEEPNALVTIGTGARREPNTPATMVELHDGLVAESQNRWPSLDFDVLAVNGLLAPLFSAGFYYKTFMWPAAFWEKVYEPLIRRAAGLGRPSIEPDPDHYAHEHDHCDVLVAGSGPAGLAAALAAGRAGARVLLVEQDTEIGIGPWHDPEQDEWRRGILAALSAEKTVRMLTRTTAVGAYDHGVFAALERRATPEGVGPRLVLHVIRARKAVMATGASERIVAFPGNDVPGVMLASAIDGYATRFGVLVGERIGLFGANDTIYAVASRLAGHGAGVTVIDPRVDVPAAEAARAAGVTVRAGHEIAGTSSARGGLHGIRVRRVGTDAIEDLSAGVLGVSGGFSPNVQLASQARVPLVWSDEIHGFVPGEGPVIGAGAARGVFGVREAARDGAEAGRRAASEAGFDVVVGVPAPGGASHAPTEPAALYTVAAKGKAFVDLQHDVTVEDVRLAHREGFVHVEHMKRYTTHGMATDQGRVGGLVGSAVLAEARGVSIAEVGLPTYRPYAVPVPIGALAGADVGHEFKPVRRLPLHDWHERNHAVFVRIGLWMRPLVYSKTKDTSWGPVLEEARAVRASVGLTDVSSLGKIEVTGPDAARFLDLVHANTFSTLPIGRARYGLMLREDGILFDDGTTSRLGQNRYLVTTTTQKADEALAHLEWHLRTVWPELDVTLTNVADHWAQFALAGPRSRDVLAKVTSGLDVSDAAFPYMAAGEGTFAGVKGRLYRISFSGERAYEIGVPAARAEHVWTALLAAGAEFGIRPHGLDALNVLRIEKGHVTGAEINGTTTPGDLGLGKMLKKKGDFVGRVLGGRPGLLEQTRAQLVGLHPLDPTKRLRGGAHLVAADGTGPSQGFVTSACMAAEGEGWIGLALLSGGHKRHGEPLVAASPVYGETVEVVITSPHRVDPENERVRG